MSEAIGMLTALRELRAMLDAARMDMQTCLDSIMTKEQHQQVADIQMEFVPRIEEMEEKIKEYEQSIRDAVLAAGESQAADGVQAVYAKGRVSWDTRALDALTDVHPWLAKYKRVGEPSVSIRTK